MRKSTDSDVQQTTMRLTRDDREALERIVGRNPTVQNFTDAMRHAIHFTDRAESTNGVAA